MAKVVRDSDHSTPAGSDGTGFLILASLAAGALAVAWSTINAGLWAAGEDFILNPVQAIISLATGQVPWNWASWALLVTELFVVAVFAWLLLSSGSKSTNDKTNGQAARMMARPTELKGLSGKEATAKAQRLYSGASAKDPQSTGLIIGRTVAKPETNLYMSWEDTAVVLAGQRMGKTQAYVTTSILGAPGPCVATANKRDVVDLTRMGREAKGKVWVFDLQNIATESAMDWWWNPLRQVKSVADARKLANYFAASTRSGDAKQDAYFDTAAQDLLAVYILAAAKADGDLLHVLEWLKNGIDDTPVQILRAVGETSASLTARSSINLSERQKDGVFEMASNFISVLTDSRYAKAVTPPARARLTVESGQIIQDRDWAVRNNVQEFNVVDFATSTDTIYALSVEGPDSPSALTTALVGQIIDGAQQVARKIPGGRLNTPMVCVLDEAANVVRLSELPSLYSYCGSQGILLMTFLQSQSQARRVWGADGFRAMMESSNIVIYGGGIKDKGFLGDISAMIGNMRVSRTSTSVGTHSSFSTSFEKKEIMGIDDLQALPSSHAVVMSSGNRPTLAKKVFWSMSPFKKVVEASMTRAQEEAQA